MSKFNVGDKVKIVETRLDKQRVYRGRICEIVKTDFDGVFLDNMSDDDDYYLDTEVELVKPNLYGEPVFDYIDDIMDTSNRPVVDLSDHFVDSLYPYIVDIETCGNNLFDNFKVQTDFYERCVKGTSFDDVDSDSIDALRYCINDLITTNNCCEKIEEEKDMNKVVNLWYERKRNKIIEKYDELEAEFNTTKYSVVESFNELVQRFNEDLESLYKMDKATEQFVLKENAPNNVVKYCIDYERIDKEFEEEYRNKRDEELKEIKDIKDEVEAQLSLSDDLKYQQEVLERYNIINKKTKKIVD